MNHNPVQQSQSNNQRSTPPIYPNWYKVLQLPSTEDLNAKEIHQAYFTQAALHDPNNFTIGTEDHARAVTYSKIIKHAYEVLSNKDRKNRYDSLRYQIRSKFDKDQLIERSKTLAEGWLKSTESKTRATEEASTSELAKKRLNEFFEKIQNLRIKHPNLPSPKREEVSKFFANETLRRKLEIESNRSSHRSALELMILAEFERRSIGMDSSERRLRWQTARDEFKKISAERQLIDQQRSQRQWEFSLNQFFANHLQQHLNSQSPNNKSSSIQTSPRFDQQAMRSPIKQKRRVSINLDRPHLNKPGSPLGS
ncbi:uncharacterized protein MELLADRAFT_72870 [Melampsora larici-populina 98AG31]|uniref:J domain-containing protein n=1 Tax=Melampsora larici-populina (strain 98AG31 / pathotype 3-4-7) TaxID=747676 RepID=F4S038_MELLP|nr:uncharacterized protein MELLADRAFT_72870 [Melampsora larici-populina 98AG31]EGG02008.1 hypothetical protein MELLADRAFT_72870 [Melampsora larici-populina 98AG31]